jgi:hypothetical protein
MYSVTLGAAEGTFATSWSENPGSADGEPGRLELRLRLNGKPVEFASASATAGPMSVRGFGFGGGGGRGPGGQPRPMMSVQLSGVRKVDNQPLTLTLMIDQEQFERAVDGEIDVGGFLQESAAGFGFGGRGGGMRTVSGTLKLDAAGTTAGETVSGAFNLEISETRGGMFSRW